MSDDELFSPDAPERQKRKPNGCAMAAIGCGVGAVLLLLIAGVGIWWVAQNARQIGTDLATAAFKEGLNELDIPEDQRKRIDARIDEVGEQFKAGKITGQQLGQIFQRLGEGPLMPAGIALVAQRSYVRDSGLNEQEKKAASLAIQRFARGVIDESIPEATRDKVLDLISTMDANGNRQFKNRLTDEELRSFVEAAASAADDAGVPAEVPQVNFADEFDKAIDKALGQSAEPQLPNAESGGPSDPSQESEEL